VRDVCRTHGMAAVIVEQNVAAAMKVADHIMIMNNGRIVFDGPPDEARRTNIWSYF
jgi:branched-chain amino acid transport system ATP-binding protein